MIGEVLSRVQMAIGFKTQEFLSLLEMTEQEYLNVTSGAKMPSLKSIERLADYLNLAPELIFQDRVSYSSLESRYRGCPTVLPKQYSMHAFAKMRTASHLLRGIEILGGHWHRTELIKRFQLSESALALPNLPVSIELGKDLCNYVLEKWGNHDALVWMGKYSAVLNFESQLGVFYRTLDGPKRIYEATVNELSETHFDSYYHYRLLKLTENSTQIRVTQNPDTMDILKKKVLGSTGTCAQKLGVISSFTMYQQLPASRVYEMACIHRGDSSCTFDVNFEAAAQLRKKNRFNLPL